MPDKNAPSLENLLESLDFGEDVLHPGGLETTRELAERCRIGNATRVLDVGSGSGEPLGFLVETFHCEGTGVDCSEAMVRRATKKAEEKNLPVVFQKGDAHHLPFDSDTFDAAISECTICLLDKEVALKEMVRVVKPGGYVGFHDLCWKEIAPQALKRRLAEIEGEFPETIDDWKRLAERAGLVDVVASEKPGLLARWSRDFKRKLGIIGQLSVFWQAFKRWGIRGLRTIKESEGILCSESMGYCLVVGRKSGSRGG